MQSYQTLGYNVIACGLLYPISMEEKELNNRNRAMQSFSLFGLNLDKTYFIVDGICFGTEHSFEKDSSAEVSKQKVDYDMQIFRTSTDSFIERIKNHLRTVF